MAKLGKRAKAAREAFADKHNVSVEEAATLVKDNAKAKFDESIEIAMTLGVDVGATASPDNHASNAAFGNRSFPVMRRCGISPSATMS